MHGAANLASLVQCALAATGVVLSVLMAASPAPFFACSLPFGTPLVVFGPFFLVSLCLALFSIWAPRFARETSPASLLLSVLGLVFFLFLCPRCPMAGVAALLAAGSAIVAWQGRRESWALIGEVLTTRVTWVALVVALLVLPVLISGMPSTQQPRYEKEDVAALAACLAARGAKMYGSKRCGQCIAQKLLFGEAFPMVQFVDCQEKQKECDAAKLDRYPTWVMNGKDSLVGKRSLRKLSSWAGCLLGATTAPSKQ